MSVLRRILGFMAVAGAAVAVVVLTGGATPEQGKRYWVELDNAFGLSEGADLKVAGVRAGKVRRLTLDRGDMRALVEIELSQNGFDDLRADVRCETRPQSLIGEYFLDCRPGTSTRRLRPGATIPVEQTETTVPLDLINDIMRRPYRERFTILLSELGAGLAARGDDLDETIRRAVPALRQVDRLLAMLREQRTTIRDLYRDADRVFARVADDRGEVARFVDEARDTASAAALEDDGIRAQWNTFPTFLRELTPTLERLEATADEQIPALRDLSRAAPLLETLFRTLGPYADASRPAVRTLADAARVGRGAVQAAQAPVAELRRGVDDLPEASQNLAMTLEHLDDPRFAVEPDERAGRGPNGGYTGLESLLRYFFAQSQAINLFDASSHMLKVSLFLDRECANYTDAEDITSGKSPARCRAWLGRNQPGITSLDPTKTAEPGTARRDGRRQAERAPPARGDQAPGADAAPGGQAQAQPAAPGGGGGGPLPQLDELLSDLLDGRAPELPATPGAPGLPSAPAQPDASRDALDYLLGS